MQFRRGHATRIPDAFHHAAGPLRTKDVCEALSHELLPKDVEGTCTKLKRLVKLGILTEAYTYAPST
ncbi:hypothetical protein [Streptomyces chilikensis]|uniref:Uncharacterized protein n=1 Tax=Streptomyces chilikensis TaxID=1194079 RepID=A0ABV3EK87_9ACTN